MARHAGLFWIPRTVERRTVLRARGARTIERTTSKEDRMAKAVVDPEELRRFAQSLKRFSANLSTQMNALNGQMQALGQTWRDQEHAKFINEFEHTLRTLTRFTQASEQHIPFLLRKADRIEEYLRQR
jgi:uncharacterized protein YukE